MFLWNHLSRENGENVAQKDFIVNNGESEGVINIQSVIYGKMVKIAATLDGPSMTLYMIIQPLIVEFSQSPFSKAHHRVLRKLKKNVLTY